ncbi:MAG: tRNA preQ1(34) S-adenosylmethionine ribosyltransferase-isomerase QueA [Rhizomicrobium sp.]|jgi:S-adenosylmethionine:tRNA ribosyltransferase-isomerase
MDVAHFDFELPEDLIALRPARPRDAARLLVVGKHGEIVHAHVHDLPEYLRAGDVLVANDTKVIAARLRGRRLPRDGRPGDGPKLELLLHKRLAGNLFRAFARPVRKLEHGDKLRLGETLCARVADRRAAGEIEIEFEETGAKLDALIAAEGEIPLPPYIAGKRQVDVLDSSDYQTLFARHEGSVAAPTAGLHFTPGLLAGLQHAGVLRQTVTLHVGAGTFQPVAADDTAEHRMHAEWASVTADAADAINAARAGGSRIVSVGTTSLRTLETAAGADGLVQAWSGETDIFITPGYAFRTADILLTNFHLPRSTLFMLVCAFCGLETMKRAYAEAIAQRYRFYSYGDACLLFRAAA